MNAAPVRAVQISEFGGPEVLQVVDVPDPEAGDGQVLIRVTRAGMNFADTHQRENSYLAPYEVPLVLGAEVAGHSRSATRGIKRLVSMAGAVPLREGLRAEQEVIAALMGSEEQVAAVDRRMASLGRG